MSLSSTIHLAFDFNYFPNRFSSSLSYDSFGTLPPPSVSFAIYSPPEGKDRDDLDGMCSVESGEYGVRPVSLKFEFD